MKNAVLKNGKGFTIVELLTVMSVIAILIALLAPALNLVKDYAKEVQQRAQFHSIDVGIEMFKTEMGIYPPSKDNILEPADPTLGADDAYGGAQKLGEALAGLDLLGFHPKSAFRSDGLNVRSDGDSPPSPESYLVYDAVNGIPPNTQGLLGETAVENVQARVSFIELENANAFTMDTVYDTGVLSSNNFAANFDNQVSNQYPIVLCDVYAKKRLHSSKKTGMPILYYKARTQNTLQDSVNDPCNAIYNYADNLNLLNLGSAEDSTVSHPLSDGTDDLLDFDNMIVNTQVTTIQRPFRAESYILISAGKDGLYGTPDDVFNFEKE